MKLIAEKRQEGGLGVRALPKEEMPKRRCTQEHGENRNGREREKEVYHNDQTKNSRKFERVEKKHVGRGSTRLCNIDKQCQLGVALHRALQILI